MAYNPFNIFRRNQKALFAVLTVFIMIMFTLTFGAGDATEMLTRWAGSRKGEIVCKLDGDKIVERDLSRVRLNRVMANRFMTLAAAETAETIKAYTSGIDSRLSEQGKQMARQARTAELYLTMPDIFNNPQAAGQIRQTLRQAEQMIGFMLESPNAQPEDKEAARVFQTLLELRQRRLGADSDHYFHNAPNKSQRDTIEFMLWEKKADQLGIRFSQDDVKKLIQREFSGQFRDDVRVRENLRRLEGFTIDAVMKALASEFKVRAVQAAILGPNGRSINSAPAFGTPYEMFEFYRQQASPSTYEVIAVPAAAFINKVQGEPSEAELNELFKKHQDEEPNPGKQTPGFKEPRKISIGWIAITGEEPYYQTLATEQVKVGEVMAKASGMMTIPLPGIGGGWAQVAAAPLTIKEPAVVAAYAEHEARFKFHMQGNYKSSALKPRHEFSSLNFDDPLLATSVVRPGSMAAMLGGIVGQTAPFGQPVVAGSLALVAPIAYEKRDRIKVGLPLVLGVLPNPALMATMVGGTAASHAAEPKPLPIEALRPELLKTTIAARAKVLAHGGQFSMANPGEREQGDVTRFIEMVNLLSGASKPKNVEESITFAAASIFAKATGTTPVEKYISDFRASRGLTTPGVQFGASTAPRDEWSIEEDAGLAPLVAAQKQSLRGQNPHGSSEYMPFGRSFFWSSVFDPLTLSLRKGQPATGTYQAQAFPPQDRSTHDAKRPQYIVWRTEEILPKKTNLSTAREAVKAAWKRNKARELAQAEAKRIANEIETKGSADPLVLSGMLNELAFNLQLSIADPKVAQRAGRFTIDNVAPKAPVDPMNSLMLQAGIPTSGRVHPFAIPESEKIPYPTKEMETTLLENRDKPIKTVVVLNDAPKDTYYVATLMRRDLKSPDEFRNNVFASTGPTREIAADYMADAARKSRQTVVELLKKEFRYEETEAQKKKLDDNDKSGGRD